MLVTKPDLYQALGRSLLFSALVLSVQIPLGIGIALLLPRSGGMRNVMLLVLAVPLVVPWNMIPPIWLGLLNPDYGLLARGLGGLGLTLDYKFNALHTWLVLLLMDSWHWTGLVAILCYSALAAIPRAYYQAAAIDSANRWQVFRYIQLPAMRGVLTMAVLLRLMDSLMIYTEAFGINAGGPQGATTFLSLALGEEIAAFNYGPAAARSVLYFLVVLSIAYAFRAIVQRSTETGAGA